MSAREELPAPVRELLAALAEALDLPLPDITETAERRAAVVYRDRCRVAAIVARSVLEGCDPGESAAFLRERTAETPADYHPWQESMGGGEVR